MSFPIQERSRVSTQGGNDIKQDARQNASLRWNFSWTFFGNAVYSACQWGMLVVLAKMGTTEMVGQYGLALAIATPVIALSNLQLRAVLTTDVRERIHFGDYLSFRLLTTLAAVTIISAVPFLMRYPWRSALVILIVGVAQGLEAVSDVYWARMQFYDHMDRIAKSMIVRALLAIALLAGGVYVSGNLLWGVAGLVVARLLVILGYDVRKRSQLVPHAITDKQALRQILNSGKWTLRPRLNWPKQSELLRISITLGVIALLGSLLPSIPRYFLAGTNGEHALGIFTATAFLVSSGNLIITALGQSAFVRLAKHFAAGEVTEFNALLWKLIKIAVLLGLAGIGAAILFGRQMLTVLYRPEYGEHVDLLIVMMTAGALTYVASLLGSAVTSARFFKPQIPVLSACVVTALLSSFALVPSHGLLGAGFAVVITSTVLCAGEVVLLWLLLRGVDRTLAADEV
jgi:O-antigen/teichoic acid export membrane protein